MAEHIVKIKGHRYRYAYEEGQTVYKGPVGDAPPISPEDFMSHLKTIYDMPFSENQEMTAYIRDVAVMLHGETEVPADVAKLLMGEEEEGWAKVDGGKAMRWFIFLHNDSHRDEMIGSQEMAAMGEVADKLDGTTVTLPVEMVDYISKKKLLPHEGKMVPAASTFNYYAAMLEA
jgi:hypothetical protein